MSSVVWSNHWNNDQALSSNLRMTSASDPCLLKVMLYCKVVHENPTRTKALKQSTPCLWWIVLENNFHYLDPLTIPLCPPFKDCKHSSKVKSLSYLGGKMKPANVIIRSPDLGGLSWLSSQETTSYLTYSMRLSNLAWISVAPPSLSNLHCPWKIQRVREVYCDLQENLDITAQMMNLTPSAKVEYDKTDCSFSPMARWYLR